MLQAEDDRSYQDKIDKEKRELGLDRVQEYQGKYIQRRALIDQMLMDNSKADFSYAERKYKWKSENPDGELANNGYYNNIDLAEWYRVYNQTQIN